MDKWNTAPPEKDGTYLCTVQGQTINGAFRFINICEFKGGQWDEKRVIAWMSLPDIWEE